MTRTETKLDTKSNRALQDAIITQVRDDIDYMHDKTYKLAHNDSYTPVWNEIYLLSEAFSGFDDFTFDTDYFEVGTAESLEDDVYDALHHPEDFADGDDLKKEHPYLRRKDRHLKKFGDDEVLKDSDYPEPLTDEDIQKIFKLFKKAILKSKFTADDKEHYDRDFASQSILNYIG